MIVKMKFVTLTGPRDDIDRMVDKYLSGYDIHLENAMSELSQVHDLRPYVQANPYRQMLAKANTYCSMVDKVTPVPADQLPLEEAVELVRSLDENLTVLAEHKAELEEEQAKCNAQMASVKPYVDIMDEIDDILGFKFIGFRFGRFPKMYLYRFKEYMYDNFDTILQECGEDDEYVYCVYFAPHAELHRIEAVYSSMHFERLFIPDEYRSDPGEAFRKLSEKKADIDEEIADIDGEMKKILILEDEEGIREELIILLSNSGYEAQGITDFSDPVGDILRISPDMILLDISLPGVNGKEILREVRKKSQIPIIMVTSSDAERDEVITIGYGADEYITKPYNPTLLLLRMGNIFKRMGTAEETADLAGVTVNFRKSIIVGADGTETVLSKNEMLILSYLYNHRGKIVTRDELMTDLWNNSEYLNDNALTVNISRLRGKLSDAGMEGVIETRKGQGYILEI